jgi:hypothetical protein
MLIFSSEDLKNAKRDLKLITQDYPEVLGVGIGDNRIICYLSKDTIIPDNMTRMHIPVCKVIVGNIIAH